MSGSSEEPADAFGEAILKEGNAAPAAGGPVDASASSATPAQSLRPWEAQGRKYPSAFDYQTHKGAQHWNRLLDRMAKTDGLAHDCLVGEAMQATFDYYGGSADVHPLVQLAIAGTMFGVGVGIGMADRKQEAAKKDETAAQDLAQRLSGVGERNVHATEDAPGAVDPPPTPEEPAKKKRKPTDGL